MMILPAPGIYWTSLTNVSSVIKATTPFYEKQIIEIPHNALKIPQIKSSVSKNNSDLTSTNWKRIL